MTINCKGELVDLDTPKVMGILNLTPDSFYDGGAYRDEATVLARVETMLDQGATFIDMGAYSSRPGAEPISEDEELRRMLPMLDLVLKNFPGTLVSIDTFCSKVAAAGGAHEAAVVNDIAAGNLDHDMIATVAELQVPYIMMPRRGDPKTMQSVTHYDDMSKEMRRYFSEKVQEAVSFKINGII